MLTYLSSAVPERLVQTSHELPQLSLGLLQVVTQKYEKAGFSLAVNDTQKMVVTRPSHTFGGVGIFALTLHNSANEYYRSEIEILKRFQLQLLGLTTFVRRMTQL